MAAFATVEQYEARFGQVADEAALAECLDDATAAIRAAMERAGADCSDPDEGLADRLMRVCRSVANRIMPQEGGMPQNVTNASMTAGPYSQSFTFGASYGTPKLLSSELEMLGVGGARCRFAQARTWEDRDD